jgi:PAS domain S-box-containing protein
MSVTGPKNATSGRPRRTHQRPRTLQGPAVEGFLCFDPKGRCTFANESAYGMLGYEHGELLGTDVREFGCPACQEDTSGGEKRCAVHRTLQTGEVCRSEPSIFRRNDGTSLYVECTTESIIEEGEATGAAVTIVDSGGPKRSGLATPPSWKPPPTLSV